jgi:hypothetical protein
MPLPLGYRNKNPTNLRYQEKWNWPGVVGIDAKRFAIFASVMAASDTVAALPEMLPVIDTAGNPGLRRAWASGRKRCWMWSML